MAAVNVGQIRSTCRSIPAATHCIIQAGTLLALVDLVKGLQGSEANLTLSPLPHPADRAVMNFTNP